MDQAAEIGSMHWALVDIRSLVWFITIRSGGTSTKLWKKLDRLKKLFNMIHEANLALNYVRYDLASN